MSLREPEFQSETEEADWLYDHRDLMSAEALLDAAAGRLLQRNSMSGECIELPPSEIPAEDLRAARELLLASGLWIEEKSDSFPNFSVAPELLRKAS